MTVTLGSGEWTFEVEESWAKVPDEIVLGDCAAVGVDSKDNAYVFNRAGGKDGSGGEGGSTVIPVGRSHLDPSFLSI